MAFFNNNPKPTNLSPRQALEVKYNSARGNMLLVVVFTLINIVLLMTNANSYFLFSAFVPYMLISEAWFYTGRYPQEAYGEYYSDMTHLYTPEGTQLLTDAVIKVICDTLDIEYREFTLADYESVKEVIGL